MKENPEQEKNDWKILVALAVGWGILRLAARTLAKVFVGNTGTAVSAVAQGHGLETAGLAAPAAPQTGRDADRDIDLEPGSNCLNHLHRGTLVAILAFAVAFAGGGDFLSRTGPPAATCSWVGPWLSSWEAWVLGWCSGNTG